MKVFLGIPEEKLGEVMRRFRKEHNYTQQKLADYLGVDRTTYSKYETAVRKPELDAIMKLTALYNVSVDEFLEDFFAVKPEKTAIASSMVSGAENDVPEILAEDEKQLLMLYRDCIRKKEMLEKAREIWAKDTEIKNQ